MEKNSPDFLIHIDEINIVVQAVTRRCSGLSSGAACRFSLLLDEPGAELWGGGLVAVTHRCVPTGIQALGQPTSVLILLTHFDNDDLERVVL